MLEGLRGDSLMKILVVDDSDMNRQLLISTLQKAGIKNDILEAVDGEIALKILKKKHNNICLIFLDWQLPNIDGLEVLKRIARNPETETMPVIMLTSATSPESEEIAHLLNPHLKAFIMKPLDPEKIVKVSLPYIK